MRWIDDHGRVFGKVNLVDLAVLLAIAALAVRFGYGAVLRRVEASTAVPQVMEATFLVSEVRQPTIEMLKPGVKLYDSKSNAYLGEIVAVRAEPSTLVGPGGEFKSATRSDLFVTVTGSGRVTPNGVTLGGLELKVGRSLSLKTALWAGTGTTWTIQTAPAGR